MAILVMPLIVIIMVVLEVTRMAPILVMVAAMVAAMAAVREGAILTFHTGHETKSLPGGWLGD